MLNKLLTGIVCFTVTACSEPAEPPVSGQQAGDSGVYLPAVTPPAGTNESTVSAAVTASPPGKVLTLWVAAEKRECMAVGPTECMQIRLDPDEDWQLFYGEIVGFDYQPGQVYQVEVSEVMIPDPPADAPDRQWVLRQVIRAD